MTPTEEINLLLRIFKSRQDSVIKTLCPTLPEVLYIIEKQRIYECRVTGAGITFGRCVTFTDHVVYLLMLMTNEITINDVFYAIEYFKGSQAYISIARHTDSYRSFEDANNGLDNLHPL